MNQRYFLSQGTYVPNMDLRYSHKAELLHSLLVAMVIALHGNKDYLWIQVTTKNICAKYEIEILSYCWVIAQFLCCYGYSCYHSSHVNHWHILSQGTYVPDMDLTLCHAGGLFGPPPVFHLLLLFLLLLCY